MRIDRGTKLIHEQYFQFYLMKNVRNNDSAFFLFFEKKEIVRDNVSAKQYKMFTLEATKSQQLQQ